ncbi:MAG: putative acyltransferase [Actinomycetia bacterium]|nr:putative acyltransferase [Actinomycetes bacterium]
MTEPARTGNSHADAAVRTADKPGQRAFYRFAHALVCGVVAIPHRVIVEGADKLPEGPYILCPSHRSMLDIPFVAFVTTRRIRFFGKTELWKYRPLGAIFDTFGGIPVERGTTDRKSIQMSLAALAGGEPLCIFPEGTRRNGPEIDEVFEGAAYIALKAGVPLVPVGIGGTERIMRGKRKYRPGRVAVVVGDPIVTPNPSVKRDVVRAVTERLHVEMQRAFDEAQALAEA